MNQQERNKNRESALKALEIAKAQERKKLDSGATFKRLDNRTLKLTL